MQYELYIDIFFLENFTMDFFLLVLLKKTMQMAVPYKRIILGALLGAFLSSLIVCIPISLNWKLLFLHLLVNVGMLGAGLGVRNYREMGRSLLLLYLFGILFGGVMGWIRSNLYCYYQIGCFFLVTAVISYFLVRKILGILEAIYKIPEKYCDVTLTMGKQTYKVRALVDSGNHLFDNVTGKPVHIISVKAIKELTKEEKISNIRYIPYCTIQKEEGVLPIVTIDKMYVHGRNQKEIKSPLMGIVEAERFAESTFEMILHPKNC